MDRFWLKNYPPGVPADIDTSRYRSVVQLIEESFSKYAARKAYDCMGKTLTFGEVDQLSRCLGAWLQSKGLARGARVAIMMPNVLQYPVAIAAVLRAGYVVVNVNPLYTPRELEHQLKDSGAEAIVIVENFATTLQQVVARTAVKHVVVAAMGDLLGTLKGAIVNYVVRNVKKMVPEWSLPGATRFNAAIAEGSRATLRPVELGPDDVAFLQYTGGTTGLSKGATLLHRNIVANVLQSEAWIQPALANPRKGPPPEQLVWVCALPLYHIFALTACGLVGMRLGGLNILVPNPRDLPALVKQIRPYKVNLFPAVNTLFNALAHHEEFKRLDFSGLRVSLGGGTAVQAAVAKAWLEVTGCPVCEAYGLSETSPGVSANPTDTDAFTGTIGLPFPSTEVRILDDDGVPVPLGQPGEIAVRGPQVMAGYWNHPEETEKVMTPDGFFKTGDVGVMDASGYTKIVDRKKDMVLVSGFNVYPNEVEGVVAGHPGVLECAVVGVPDDKTGEAVKLFVVRRDPNLTEKSVRDWCEQHLTGYKKPKHIEFRTELPKTNVGKILRRELRDGAVKKAA
ncbi:MAG TPA: long-chain-fatty-acid--CoA ligase [Burkholderiaceae bacterium]|nr:long-chain-fatty-acid--CoA ligase [Burkholderiaceae bacterium]